MTMYVAKSRSHIAPKSRAWFGGYAIRILPLAFARGSGDYSSLISSGLALVRGGTIMRALHSELDQLQTRQHRLMAEYSRLLLERSSFASLQTVETVATQELRMRFPQTIEEVVPEFLAPLSVYPMFHRYRRRTVCSGGVSGCY